MSSPTRSGELPGWRHAILNARYARAATKELSLASSWHRTTEGSRPRGSSDIPALAQPGVLPQRGVVLAIDGDLAAAFAVRYVYVPTGLAGRNQILECVAKLARLVVRQSK